MSFYKIVRSIVGPLARIVFPVWVYGKENVPQKGNFLLCSNHISYIDPVYHIVGQKNVVHFMARDNLFKRKLTGWFLKKMLAYPVKRGASDTESVRVTFDLLENGEVVGIFPEGTRSKNGELGKFKAGAILIASKADAAILPSVICTKNGKVKAFKKSVLIYGKPVTVAELGLINGTSQELKDSARKLMEIIENLRAEGLLKLGIRS